MSYTKQNWQCGDVVTAEKLNHIEQGIEDCCGGGTTVLHVVSEGQCKILDKTWQEVKDLIEAGERVVYIETVEDVYEGEDLTINQTFTYQWQIIACKHSVTTESGSSPVDDYSASMLCIQSTEIIADMLHADSANTPLERCVRN